MKVQVEPYAEGYDQKLVAAFGAGNPPDVMYMWNFPQYYTSLMPLDELIARDSAEIKPDDFPEGLMNTTRIEGKTYGMPSGFTTQVVFYNKEMFAKAGVEEPKEGWTWDDLRAKAAKFRDEAGKVYGFAVDAKPDPYDFEQFLWSNGTKYISDDGKEIDGYMNSDVAAAVLGMFADMARKEEAVTLHLGDETGVTRCSRAARSPCSRAPCGTRQISMPPASAMASRRCRHSATVPPIRHSAFRRSPSPRTPPIPTSPGNS